MKRLGLNSQISIMTILLNVVDLQCDKIIDILIITIEKIMPNQMNIKNMIMTMKMM